MKISDLKSLFLEIEKKNCLLCDQAPPARCMVEGAREQDLQLYTWKVETKPTNQPTNQTNKQPTNQTNKQTNNQPNK